MLTDDSQMPFGKYKGIAMSAVPADYLLWLNDNIKKGVANADVINYIEDNLQVLRQEVNGNKRTIQISNNQKDY